jgi:hypothetical protein
VFFSHGLDNRLADNLSSVDLFLSYESFSVSTKIANHSRSTNSIDFNLTSLPVKMGLAITCSVAVYL